MGIYRRHLLPRLIDRGMRNPVMGRYRAPIPAQASGRVLELGAGAGLNLPYYGPEVTRLFALEPAGSLLAKTAALAGSLPFPLILLGQGAEAIPLETGSIDTVVTTWTLCSVGNLEAGLAEVRRVLRRGGRLLFLEHGRAPDPAVARRQDRLEPAIHRVAGCHPNRRIDTAIEQAGFRFASIERRYLKGPRFIAYHFMGAAEPR